ncbi:hypothetical protein HaLaN_06516, partial [Haematococcus lacustris]
CKIASFHSGGPNMGLVIFMQVLSQNCTVLDSVNHIGIGALAIGVSARVLPHVPANKSQRRDGSPWHGGWHVGEYNSMRSRVKNRPWCGAEWVGGGLSATFPHPLSDPTAASDAHAHAEQPKRRGRSKR